MISRAMRQFLLSSLLTLIIQQLSITVDSIFLSHFVDTTAMAAVTLYMPLNMIIFSIETLLGYGGIIVAVRAMGQQDRDKSNGVLSTALLSLLVVGVVLGMGAFICHDLIAGMFCTTPELLTHFDNYATISLSLMTLPMVAAFLGQAVAIDGAPHIATRSAAVAFVSNIVLDWLFIVVMGWGVSGSAWATSISYLLDMGVVSIYLFTHPKSIRFGWYSKMVSRYLSPNLKEGSSLLAANLLLTLLLYINNAYVQSTQGSDGMVMLSVCMNIQSLVMLIAIGFQDTLAGVGGYLYGEGDYKGLGILFRLCLTYMLIALAACVVVIEFFPGLITSLFFVEPSLQPATWTALRYYAPYIPLYATLICVGTFYQVSGNTKLVVPSIIPLTLVQYPMFLIVSAAFGPERLWLTFMLTALTSIACVAVISEVVRRKNGNKAHAISLIPKQSRDEIMQISVEASQQGIVNVLTHLQQVLPKLSLGDNKTDAILHSLEELMLNIAAHGGKMENHFFDLRLMQGEGELHASIKDDGRPFDPTALSAEQRQAGLNIAFSYADNIDYKYMYGQNVVNLTWNITSSK